MKMKNRQTKSLHPQNDTIHGKNTHFGLGLVGQAPAGHTVDKQQVCAFQQPNKIQV